MPFDPSKKTMGYNPYQPVYNPGPEKPKSKGNVILITIIVILLSVLIGLGGLVIYEKYKGNLDSTPQENPSTNVVVQDKNVTLELITGE